MERALEDMVFEWEYLHPKTPITVHQSDLEMNCFTSHPQAPKQGKDLGNEAMAKDIHHEVSQSSDESLLMDEAMVVGEDAAFEAVEDDSDWDLQSSLFKEEDEVVGKMDTNPKINGKHGCEGFGLKIWWKSALMAAVATVSIFVLGGGKAQIFLNNRRIHSAPTKKENMHGSFDQHQEASSLSGHHDERF